jgi:hypothetical protein
MFGKSILRWSCERIRVSMDEILLCENVCARPGLCCILLSMFVIVGPQFAYHQVSSALPSVPLSAESFRR